MQLAFITMVAALVLCLWGLKDPFMGLLGLLVFNVAEPEQVFTILGTLHVEKIAGILIVISFLAYHNKLRLPPLARWILYFFGAALASIPLSFWLSNALNSAMALGKTIILAFLVVNLVTSRRRLWIFLLTYALLLGYLGVSGLVNFYSGKFYFDGQTDRLIGITNDSNAPDTLALTLVAALPMIMMFFKAPGKLLRLLMMGLAAACLWGVMLTGSRTGLYTFVVLAGVYALRSRRRFVIIPIAVVLVAGLWVGMPAQYRARYASTLSSKGRALDPAYQSRLLSWEGGWHMFLHNPLTGIGIGDYDVANGAKYWPIASHRIYLDAHSIFFKIIGELGLLGLISFTGLVICLVRTNTRLRRLLVERGEPPWLCAYPRAANYTIFVLLFAGYASHDVYRSTWYLLAGVTAALGIYSEGAQPKSEATPSAEAALAHP